MENEIKKGLRWSILASFFNSIFCLLTGFFWGYLSDRFGKRPVIFLSLLFYSFIQFFFITFGSRINIVSKKK